MWILVFIGDTCLDSYGSKHEDNPLGDELWEWYMMLHTLSYVTVKYYSLAAHSAIVKCVGRVLI